MALPALGEQVESLVIAATFDQAEAVCRPAMSRCHLRSCRGAREYLFGSRPAKSAKSKAAAVAQPQKPGLLWRSNNLAPGLEIRGEIIHLRSTLSVIALRLSSRLWHALSNRVTLKGEKCQDERKTTHALVRNVLAAHIDGSRIRQLQ